MKYFALFGGLIAAVVTSILLIAPSAAGEVRPLSPTDPRELKGNALFLCPTVEEVHELLDNFQTWAADSHIRNDCIFYQIGWYTDLVAQHRYLDDEGDESIIFQIIADGEPVSMYTFSLIPEEAQGVDA